MAAILPAWASSDVSENRRVWCASEFPCLSIGTQESWSGKAKLSRFRIFCAGRLSARNSTTIRRGRCQNRRRLADRRSNWLFSGQEISEKIKRCTPFRACKNYTQIINSFPNKKRNGQRFTPSDRFYHPSGTRPPKMDAIYIGTWGINPTVELARATRSLAIGRPPPS